MLRVKASVILLPLCSLTGIPNWFATEDASFPPPWIRILDSLIEEKSLRKGIEDYDRRRGWRGPITNKIKNKNWEKKITQYKLDPTLNWNLAEIVSINSDSLRFKLFDKSQKNLEGLLTLKNIKWTLRNKKIYPLPQKNLVKKFPIKKLDYPNFKDKKDLQFHY